jgi:VIT1/CCC1 family predicted Fe2+/Mn2+ transporter
VIFAVTVSPFLAMEWVGLDRSLAGTVAVLVALTVLFSVGAYLARLAGGPQWRKGLRMALIGVLTFGAIWLIQTFPAWLAFFGLA